MRFIVLGAGAIGCHVGGRLAQSGADVTLVGRARMMEAIAREGLRITTRSGSDDTVPPERLMLRTSLQEAVASVPYQERRELVLLLCTKTTATRAAGKEIAALGLKPACVLSLQNGVDNARVLREAGVRARVLPAMVACTVNGRGDTHVHCANERGLVVQQDPMSERLASAFTQAGIPMDLSDNLQGVLWGKLLLNLINPVNALANVPVREQMLDRDYRAVFAALQDEALHVLKAAGITPAKVAAPPTLIPKILRLPNWLFQRVARKMLDMDPSAKTSMCADLQRGRTTEIDDLCGAVVRLAAQHHCSAPLNQAMCQLIHGHKTSDRWTGSKLRAAVFQETT